MPLSVINPNWVTDISSRILFLILLINTLSVTFVRWLIRLIYGAGHIQLYPFLLGIAMYTDFLRSVGISPVTWIMFKRFVISMIPNFPRAVSITDGISSGPAALPFFIFLRAFFTSSSRIWGPSSLLMIGGGPLSSWHSSVMYSDHVMRISS